MAPDHSNSSSPIDSTTGDLNDSLDDSMSDSSIVSEGKTEASVENKLMDSDFEDKAVACFRLFVLFILTSAVIASGVATWHYMTEEQNEEFNDLLDLIADDIAELSSDKLSNIVGECKTTSLYLTSFSLQSSDKGWPFFYDPNFEPLGMNFREFSSADILAFTPLVQYENKQPWEEYSVVNQNWITDGLQYDGVEISEPIPSIPKLIYQHGPNGTHVTIVGPGPYAPMWQISPPPTDSSVVNLDTFSEPIFAHAFEHMQNVNKTVLSDLINPALFFGPMATTNEPVSFLLNAIGTNFSSNSEMAAIMIGSFRWRSFFILSLEEHDNLAITVILDDQCGESFTFLIDDEGTTFQGYGDQHDKEFDKYERKYDFAPDLEKDYMNDSPDCMWIIRMYPTTQFYDKFNTNRPTKMTAVVVGVFLGMAIIFCLYDCAVHSRQRRLLAIAAQSERILSILYPKQIRDRLFGHSQPVQSTQLSLTTKTKSSKKKRKCNDPVKNAKFQLKEYINQGQADGSKPLTDGKHKEPFDDKPIADLFPHTTVLLADITGFTAWSSVREPSQVFTLLETAYHAFDNIARRRRIFKVETVGDCYVAVTGLPEPRRDHAIAMARFARECIQRFNDLVSHLETTLGPDTGDLGLRVGVHSGPVTAGVLRGEKSRFQLFGDTVNTAARIESTGMKNKIHASMETAELLQLSGKSHWVKRREHEVEAKGKGKLQTYWILLKDEMGRALSSVGEHSSSDGAAIDDEFCNNPPSEAAMPVPQETARKNFLSAACADDIELPVKIDRLVKWNVDVLLRLLKQIVAKRNAMGPRRNNDVDLAKAEEKIRMKFMVLDEVVNIIPLPGFDHRVYKNQEDPDSIVLPDAVVEQMRLYVTMIAVMYRENHFHNFEHASHVMMSVSKLLSRIIAADDLWNVNEDASKSKDFGFSLHDHTYGITSDPMTQFSVILAALIHDVDHMGISNFQLIKEEHQLAKLFKNKSIAEQNSVVLAWDTLMDPKFHDLRRTIYADTFELERFRQLVANTVLATDIFDKELAMQRKNRWEIAFSSRPVDDVSTKDDINRKATIVIEHLIQASDVAHTMQHWNIYSKWNERLFAEMLAAFKCGRMEKSPADFWYEGEIGFFDNYIIPLAKKLKDCGVFGASSDEYLNYALENRREWEMKGKDVVKSLIDKYQTMPPGIDSTQSEHERG